MSEWLRKLPKAELHVHLEGSITPAVLLQIDPALSKAAIRGAFQFRDFAGFLEAYKWVNLRLTRPEHYGLAAARLIRILARQGVTYAEVTVSAGVILWKKQPLDEILEHLQRAAAAAPFPVYWIFDAIRHFGVDHAWQVAQFAASRREQGIVGFGIGGDEARGPASWFGEVFRYCRVNGVRVTAHAGETCGPESVWAALEAGAERIGHGIRSVTDNSLLRHLASRRVPLEVCVTSNVATGAVDSLAGHPLARLHEAGVPLILNTDDPALFRCSLTHEYALAASRFGFSSESLRALARNSFEFAFHPSAVAQAANARPL